MDGVGSGDVGRKKRIVYTSCRHFVSLPFTHFSTLLSRREKPDPIDLNIVHYCDMRVAVKSDEVLAPCAFLDLHGSRSAGSPQGTGGRVDQRVAECGSRPGQYPRRRPRSAGLGTCSGGVQ